MRWNLARGGDVPFTVFVMKLHRDPFAKSSCKYVLKRLLLLIQRKHTPLPGFDFEACTH